MQSFLGLANYYNRYINNVAGIATPLSDLLVKGTPFTWGPRELASFEALKTALCTAPCLALPDMSGVFVVETDASDKRVGAVLQ